MMSGHAHGWLVAVGVAGVLLLGGCSDGSTDTGSPSAVASPSLSSSTLPELLATVEWPDDEATIAAVFADLPEDLSGLARVEYPPGPETEPRYEAYYGEPDAVGIALHADPGSGITTPAHGMALMAAVPGPQTCVDDEYSPLFADLFQLETRNEVEREVQRISQVRPTPGELLWVICTQTATESDDPDTPVALPEDEWVYVAGWADGGWFYIARASSPEQRMDAVAALTEAVLRDAAGE